MKIADNQKDEKPEAETGDAKPVETKASDAKTTPGKVEAPDVEA